MTFTEYEGWMGFWEVGIVGSLGIEVFYGIVKDFFLFLFFGRVDGGLGFSARCARYFLMCGYKLFCCMDGSLKLYGGKWLFVLFYPNALECTILREHISPVYESF